MPTYDSASFPRDAILANGTITGGPIFETRVVHAANGTEQRNGLTGAHARRVFSLDTSTITDSVRNQVLAFFDAARGQSDSFRFTDPFDFQASGEPIVSGQLVKRYTVGATSYDRPITKPVSGTVSFSGGGTLDYETGIISGGAGGTWSGQFEIQARFATDHYIETNYYIDWHEVKVTIVEAFDSDIPAVTTTALGSTITYEFPLKIEVGRERYQDYSTRIYMGGGYSEDRFPQYVSAAVGFSGNCLMKNRTDLETLISTFLCVRGRRTAFQREGFNVRFGEDQLNIAFSGVESFQCPIRLIGVL